MREIIGGLVLMLGLGCATVAPPQALLEARSRFDTDVRSDAARSDFRGLWAVKQSLDDANRLYQTEPGSEHAQAAARRALAALSHWELMVQMEKLDQTMNAVAAADALSEPMNVGEFRRHSESEESIGALGAAVRGLGEVKQDRGAVTLRFASGALFDRGERQLKVAAKVRLEQAAAAMKQFSPDARVRVVASAEEPAGASLAADRAREVRDCLVDSGVPAQNVISSSHGGALTPDRRQVEIVIEPLDLPR